MNIRLLPGLLVTILILSSCSQNGRLYRKANKHFEKGLYEVAVIEAAKSLRLKPDNAKAQDLLVIAWDNAIKQREEKIARIEQSSDPNKWDQIFTEYTALQNMGDNLRSLPVLVNPYSGYRVVVNIPELGEKIATSRTNAAEAHYQAGIRFNKMSSDLETQKKAALEFKAAMNFIPDYKDSALKYDQSRKLAVKRLAISPFEDKSSANRRYGAISDLLTDQVISQIMSLTAGSDFIEIIARSQINTVLAEQELSASGLTSEGSTVRLGQILGAHEILTGRILQITATKERTVSVTQEATNRVVIGKEQYVDDNGETKERNVWGDVTCSYRKYTKTAGVSISGSFSILDVETGKIKLQESLEIKKPWSESWCRKISGDDRALSDNIKRMMDKAEPFPPDETEMVVSALRDLGNGIVQKTRNYLN